MTTEEENGSKTRYATNKPIKLSTKNKNNDRILILI